MDTTTERTVSAPRVKDCAAARPSTSDRSRLRTTALSPSTASRTRWGRIGADGRGGASYRSRSSSAADHSEAAAATANTTVDVGDLEQHRREQRSDQRGGGVEHAADHVGAGQLVSGVAQGGEQRRVRRTEERGCDRRQHGERVDRCRRTTHAATTAAAAVTTPRRVDTTTRTRSRRPRSASGRQQRRADRGGDHPQQPHQSEGRRAAVAVGHDARAPR